MSARGLSLVELMIAVALGSVLCLAATTVLLKSKRAYLQDEQLARLQENGHYALRLLSRELSMAGFYGEALPEEIMPAGVGGNACYRHLVDLSATFSHYDNVSASGKASSGEQLPSGCARPGDHLAGSDVLVMRRAMDRPAQLRGESLVSMREQMLYLRVDRHGAGLVRGTTAAGPFASLWRFHPQLYFLRKYSRQAGDSIPALCRIRLSPEARRTAPVECLVEGVEQMQFEFGIDTNGDTHADHYVATLSGVDADRVVLARIYLLVRTPLPLPGHTDPGRYVLGNAEYGAPGDAYFRRVLSTSILLRNSDVHRS